MAEVRGKVAKILNSREIVINLGSDQGVTEGMIFNVLDPSGEDIKDPDTGRTLGSLRRTKLQVRVNAVQEKMAVAITFKKTTYHIGNVVLPSRQTAFESQFASIAKLLDVKRTVVKEETLKKPEGTYDPLDEKDSYVKVGDIVELVHQSEASDEHS